MNDREGSTSALLVDVLERSAALDALATEPMSKRRLAAAIGVSDATAQRIIASFREWRLVERTQDGNEVTPLGHEVRRAVDDICTRVEASRRLEPLFESVALDGVSFDVDAFADATITLAEPGDPYRPLNRFTTLLADTSSLRGFDTTSVAPMYVEDIYERIVDGLPVDIVFEEAVVERLASDYDDLATEAFAQDNLTVSVHDDLPFGLALFDDRVAIGGYDDVTGVLQVFVDSDDPAGIAWGEDVFEQFRDEATELK